MGTQQGGRPTEFAAIEHPHGVFYPIERHAFATATDRAAWVAKGAERGKCGWREVERGK